MVCSWLVGTSLAPSRMSSGPAFPWAASPRAAMMCSPPAQHLFFLPNDYVWDRPFKDWGCPERPCFRRMLAFFGQRFPPPFLLGPRAAFAVKPLPCKVFLPSDVFPVPWRPPKRPNPAAVQPSVTPHRMMDAFLPLTHS